MGDTLSNLMNESAPATTEQTPTQETPTTETTAEVTTETTAEATTAETTEPTVAENATTETTTDNPNDNPSGLPGTTPEKPVNSFASEKVAKYNEFVKKTGKDDWKEFEFLTTPAKELDPKELLRKFYSEQEGMSEKEIAFALSELEVAPSDDDDDFGDGLDEKEILRREAKMEGELRKASKWHDANLQDFSAATSDSEPEVQRYTFEEVQEIAQKEHQNLVNFNREQVYKELPNITSVELSYQGNKDLGIDPVNVNYTPDEEYMKHARTVGEDVGVLINSFFDEKNQLKDPKGFISTVTKAYAPTSQAMTNFLIEQAVLNDRAKRDKLRRNVSPEVYQTVNHSNSTASEAFEKDYQSRNRGPFG